MCGSGANLHLLQHHKGAECRTVCISAHKFGKNVALAKGSRSGGHRETSVSRRTEALEQ